MLPQLSNHISVVAVAAAGLAAAAIDLRTRRVPNTLSAGVAVSGFAIAALRLGTLTFPMAAIGCVVGLLLMLPGYVFGATGAGDVKLFAALGTLVGPSGIVLGFFYTAIAGGLMAVGVALMRASLGTTLRRAGALVATRGGSANDIERSELDNRFAYAPAIAVGVMAAALSV
jgi:prepilin peptidase CpaA